MDDFERTVAGIFTICGVLIVFAFLIGLVVGSNSGISCEQRRAIVAGVGRWEADRSSGESRFVYGCPEDRP